MVYANACDPIWLRRYANMIRDFDIRFKDVKVDAIWALLYQCDNRFRREVIPRLIRAAEIMLARIIPRAANVQSAVLTYDLPDGRQVVYEPNSPWNYIFACPNKD